MSAPPSLLSSVAYRRHRPPPISTTPDHRLIETYTGLPVMSLNTAHTADGRGVLIYNGEMILLYTKEVDPVFGANYLKGTAVAQPQGNWEGDVVFKLTFNKGGCIDFGQALLKAADMAHRFRPYDAPPAYAPPPGSFFAAPPAYYTPAGNNYNGFVAPTNVFPDQPPAGNVFMYDAPPPYSGIGPDRPPVPLGQAGGPPMYSNIPGASAPTMPPSYEQASALPRKE